MTKNINRWFWLLVSCKEVAFQLAWTTECKNQREIWPYEHGLNTGIDLIGNKKMNEIQLQLLKR